MRALAALQNRWRDMGLAKRIVGVSLVLLLVVQFAGFGVIRSNIAQNARTQINHELDVGERVWSRVLSQNEDKLQLGASVLAADFGFRSAVHSGDMETIRSALDNHGSRIGARISAQFDADLRLQAISHADTGHSTEVLTQLAHSLVSDRQTAGRAGQMALLNGVPHQFVMVPMRAPLVIGWVLMGFSIDQALADDVYDLLDVHLVVLTRPPGESVALSVSTLTAMDLKAFPLDAMAVGDGEVRLQNQLFLTRAVNLDGKAGQVTSLLMRSVDQVLAPFVRLQWLLFFITLGGVVLFAMGSVLIARRVTQPLQALLQSVQKVKEGDFSVTHAAEVFEDLTDFDPDNSPTNRFGYDEVGTLSRAFHHMRQAVADKQTEVEQLAYWDRLTGLPNREQFRLRLLNSVALHKSDWGAVSVITLNLDRFKHVNDVLGYAFGDELLKAVAQRLTGQLHRDHDCVARLGGDEFVLLLDRTDGAQAILLCQRIARAFEEPLALNGQTVDVSASMGVACWPDDADAPDLLLSRSEIAMHAAKSRTVGILCYEPSLDSSSAQNLSLLTDLRRALDEGELRLYLQPKINVATGRVMAAEALVRWQHPQRGLVPPMLFIPFAEQTGFVRQLTLWMFEAVAREWQGLQQNGQNLRVAINLSTRDLLDLEFPSRLAVLMARYQVPTSGFCLEITESAIMDDPQRAEATLNKLSAQGFKLSIDDFGTGYSSLAYLKRLPVNELKIDKSFVMGMEHDQNDAKIVRSTIDLAHNLGLTVVAEGVENAAILAQLGELHCDEAQGYHMGKPVPVSDFTAHCDRWHRSGAFKFT